MKRIFYLIISVMLVFPSCMKDIDEFIPDPGISQFNYVVADIGGQVIDENGEALPGVEISINTRNGEVFTITDDQGIFLTRNIEVREDLAYIKANLTGYFHASKSLYAIKNSLNHLNIKMIEQQIIGSVSSSNGGSVETPEGAMITLPANGFVDENGNAYEGNVNVAAVWLDPTAEDLEEKMPGALLGLNADEEIQVLATAGMMGVELIGDGGETLNLGNGMRAELRFPLPESLTSEVPETIALWSFDELSGQWVEEGFAVKNGTEYIGEVSHFSFWNCDDPFPLVNASGKVLDTEGNPIANVKVRIRLAGGSLSGSGWTNENGCYEGPIPMGQDLVLEIIDECGDIAHSMNIGPFSEDVVLPTVEIDLANQSSVHLYGNLVDCDGSPVQDGYVNITFGMQEMHAFVDVNGQFDLTFLNCSLDLVHIQGFDLGNAKESIPATFSIANEVDAGTLQVCSDLTEYITFNLDGEDYLITEPNGGAESDFVQIWSDNGQVPSISFIWFGTDLLTTYNVDQFSIAPPDTILNTNITTIISELGDVGEQILGDFEGSFEDSDGVLHTISGNYRVDIDF